MRTLFIAILVLVAIPHLHAQSIKKLEQLPATTQATFKKIAAQYQTGPVTYGSIANDLQKNNIDFSNMPIEDAVMLLFSLISEDARKEVASMTAEMDATRKKKSALRESNASTRKTIDSLKNLLRQQYNKDSLATKKNIHQKEQGLQQQMQTENRLQSSELTLHHNKTAAEQHLESVQAAIKKLELQRKTSKP